MQENDSEQMQSRILFIKSNIIPWVVKKLGEVRNKYCMKKKSKSQRIRIRIYSNTFCGEIKNQHSTILNFWRSWSFNALVNMDQPSSEVKNSSRKWWLIQIEMNSTTNVSNVRHQLPVYVSWIVTSLCQIQGGYQEQEQEQKQRKQKKELGIVQTNGGRNHCSNTGCSCRGGTTRMLIEYSKKC